MANILVIEDDEIMAQLMAASLEDMGHTLRIAGNGQMGLDEVARLRPDLIVLDMNMPVMDGFEFAKRFRSDPENRSIPILASSDESHPASYDAAYDAGCNGFLSKPWSKEELVERIGEFLK
jgi:CheY-like chemotaxis protein